jgi:hypothetical protein
MGKKTKIKEKEIRKQNICVNKDCKIRKAGCKGSQNCPGFKSNKEE